MRHSNLSRRDPRADRWQRPGLTAELILALLGVGVASYLSAVHLSGAQALCAGLGQCELVQASEYSRLAGVPVAYLGLGTYLLVLAAIYGRRRWSGPAAELALLAQFGLVLVGVLFSGWLTYVELFILHAICPWCVTSAVIMLLLGSLTCYDLVVGMHNR
jgi:uncharacterized membrane protein